MKSSASWNRHGWLAVNASLILVAGCGADGATTPEVTAATSEAFTSAACADGTGEDSFSSGMVGCSGAVTWANRASLCGAGYRPASANEWNSLRGGTAPTHDYWVNESLRYSGSGSGSCQANEVSGFDCGSGDPMRVCTSTGSDAEGNACNWVGCGLEVTSNQYFGGCVGNATAGTLCVPSGCADGSVEQTFNNGLIGCAGSVTWANASSLCAPGFRLAEDYEWVDYHGSAAPTHDYWTAVTLAYEGSATSCYVDYNGTACPSGEPMRVCSGTSADPEGNVCNWANCGYFSVSPNEYFGGCFGNTTAGALCVATSGCADGTAEQLFNNNIVGCAGSVAWSNQTSLCAVGWIKIGSADWVNDHGSVVPLHDYWTGDNLLFDGSSTACFASTTTGSACTAGEPMRVCTTSGSDPEGNACNWTNCGLNATTPNEYFGGCDGNATAGTLCAFPIQ
jgi:hypothetical protein